MIWNQRNTVCPSFQLAAQSFSLLFGLVNSLAFKLSSPGLMAMLQVACFFIFTVKGICFSGSCEFEGYGWLQSCLQQKDHLPVFILFAYYLFHYFESREREPPNESFCLLTSKYKQQPNREIKSSMQVSYMGSRDTTTWTIPLLPTKVCISRNLE